MGSTTRVIVNLTIFIIIIFLFVYFYKKFIMSNKMFTKRSRYIEQVDKYYLANDRWIEIVKIGTKYLMLGVTSKEINEIKEITQEDLHELALEKDENAFKTILSKYTRQKDKTIL